MNLDGTFFFFNDTATTEIYTLSLHDALPIFSAGRNVPSCPNSSTSSLVRVNDRLCTATGCPCRARLRARLRPMTARPVTPMRASSAINSPVVLGSRPVVRTRRYQRFTERGRGPPRGGTGAAPRRAASATIEPPEAGRPSGTKQPEGGTVGYTTGDVV